MKPLSMSKGRTDDFQTPRQALKPLLPFLKKEWLIWECAEGKGNLTKEFMRLGYRTIGTDLLFGYDFLKWQPDKFDCVITNPPYSLKQDFLIRAYSLNKPFAFLLPLTTFETTKRQELFKNYGVEVILFDKRINFETPSGRGSGSWFAVAWFTWGFKIGKQLTFVKFNSAPTHHDLFVNTTPRHP